jgi:hypothetical protein
LKVCARYSSAYSFREGFWSFLLAIYYVVHSYPFSHLIDVIIGKSTSTKPHIYNMFSILPPIISVKRKTSIPDITLFFVVPIITNISTLVMKIIDHRRQISWCSVEQVCCPTLSTLCQISALFKGLYDARPLKYRWKCLFYLFRLILF